MTLTLGLAGGLDPVHQELLDCPGNYTYDGAAVLVEDGLVVAAVEEARVDRIKRSNKFPLAAARACLEQHHTNIEAVDRIAYYAQEAVADRLMARLRLAHPELRLASDARSFLTQSLEEGLQVRISNQKIRFYDHKLTHAVGAFAQSGFDEALIYIIDYAGGLFCGSRCPDNRVELTLIEATPPEKYLAKICQAVLPCLGFGPFEEYKAMALAPYGDAQGCAELIAQLFELLPGGDYVLYPARAQGIFREIEPPRDGKMLQVHMDVAAALQQAMEKIVLHVLRAQRERSGQRRLCMSGGMVENSATNGKVLYSQLFDEIFVHPVASDAGCALGAALLAAYEESPSTRPSRIRRIDWGTDVGRSEEIEKALASWEKFLVQSRTSDVARDACEQLTKGAVIGWAQGRAEFGSKALGNRNVFASAGSRDNSLRMNKVLRRTETYRPLAMAILEEDAPALLDAPTSQDTFPFMTYVLRVREEQRCRIPAATQLDGSARVHTVARETNPRLWELIHSFKQLTNIPAVLSASLNNPCEPTAETVHDVITTFLTTDLDYLFIGDFVVAKRRPLADDWLGLKVSLPRYARVVRSNGYVRPDRPCISTEVRTSFDSHLHVHVSEALGDLLLRLDGERSLDDILPSCASRSQSLLTEVQALWSRRLITLRP